MTRHSRFPLAFTLACVAIALPAASFAQPSAQELIEQAREEMAQLNIESGIALYEQAEATGQNEREQLIEIFRARAESQAALGRSDASERAFRNLLALDPTFSLPEGSSPKLMQPFTAANEFLAGRAVAIECRSNDEGALLVVLSDPVDLVTGARLLSADGSRAPGTIDGRGSGRIVIDVPDEAKSASKCAALDQYGNQLIEVELIAAPKPVDSTDMTAQGAGTTSSGAGLSVTGEAPSRSRPLYARWWLWGSVAAVSAGVTVYFGLKVQKAKDDIEELNERSLTEDVYYEDALAIEDRGKTAARNTNIALGATAAFTALSAGLLIHQLISDDGPAEPVPGAARIDAAPLQGGGAVSFTVGF